MIRSVSPAFVLVAMAACASDSPVTQPGELYTDQEKAAMSTEEKVAKYNEQVEEKDELICRRQVVTGSHMHRVRCRTLEEIQQEREEAQDALMKSQREGSN